MLACVPLLTNPYTRGWHTHHSGEGGESIYDGGKPFKDEIHTRLKFTHRGLLAMANENRPNSNTSQFFLTLDACEHLKVRFCRVHLVDWVGGGLRVARLLAPPPSDVGG